jgi:hypothetical protein
MPCCTVVCPQDVQLGDVELPGQYLSGAEVNPDSIIYLEGIGADVAIVRRNASSFRRLSLLCSDGHTRHMLVQVGGQAFMACRQVRAAVSAGVAHYLLCCVLWLETMSSAC